MNNEALKYLRSLRGYAADPGHWEGYSLSLPIATDLQRWCGETSHVRGWCGVFSSDAPPHLHKLLGDAIGHLKYSPDFDWPVRGGAALRVRECYYTPNGYPELVQARQLKLLDAIIAYVGAQR